MIFCHQAVRSWNFAASSRPDSSKGCNFFEDFHIRKLIRYRYHINTHFWYNEGTNAMNIFMRWIRIRPENTNPDQKSQNGANIEISINSRIFKELREMSAGIKYLKASEKACSSNLIWVQIRPFQDGTGITGSTLGSKLDYTKAVALPPSVNRNHLHLTPDKYCLARTWRSLNTMINPIAKLRSRYSQSYITRIPTGYSSNTCPDSYFGHHSSDT